MKDTELFRMVFCDDIPYYNPQTRTVCYMDLTEDDVYGLTTYTFPDDVDVDKIREEYGSLISYCNGCIPAAGTGCKDRLGFIPIQYLFDFDYLYRELGEVTE